MAADFVIIFKFVLVWQRNYTRNHKQNVLFTMQNSLDDCRSAQ